MTLFVDRVTDRWAESPFGPRRRMAWLFTYRQKAQYVRSMEEAGGFMEGWRDHLMGCPIYIGPWNPDPLPLFLPEPTVRSMVGLWDGPRSNP